jgi:hypothetical protein
VGELQPPPAVLPRADSHKPICRKIAELSPWDHLIHAKVP